MARRKIVQASKILFVRVGSPSNAVRLFDWLRDHDFVVFDEDMAERLGMFVVIGATYNKLRTAMHEAKEYDVLEHPYKVNVKEVREGRTALASKKKDRPPTASEILSMLDDD